MSNSYNQIYSRLWNARQRLRSAENEAAIVTERAKHINDAFLRRANPLSDNILQNQDIIWKDRVLECKAEVKRAQQLASSIEDELNKWVEPVQVVETVKVSKPPRVVDSTENDALLAKFLGEQFATEVARERAVMEESDRLFAQQLAFGDVL